MTDGTRILGMPALWARRLLVVSLALNFLVVGLIVGVGAGKEPRTRMGGTTAHMRAEIVALISDVARRTQAEALMKESASGWRELRKLRNQRWESIAGGIETRPFTAEGLLAIFDSASAQRNEAAAAGRVAMAEAIALMTDDERAALAASLRAFREERARRWRERNAP